MSSRNDQKEICSEFKKSSDKENHTIRRALFCHLSRATVIFLICRRARRQRSQSPILVTVRIDKHFKLYIDWSLSGKSKSSQLASHVMESTSRFLLIAQSAIRKAATLQSSYSRTATTHDCKNMQMKSQHWVAPNCTCRRAFNCKQPQCSNCIRLTS